MRISRIIILNFFLFLFSSLMVNADSIVQSTMSQDPSTVRSQIIQIEQNVFHEFDPSIRQSITLQLYDNIILSIIFTKEEVTSSGNIIWRGEIIDHAMSNAVFVLSKERSLLRASIRLIDSNHIYNIESIGDNNYLVSTAEPKYTSFDKVVFPTGKGYGEVDHQELPRETSIQDDGSTLDVLVVYTPGARNQAGGDQNIIAEIELAASDANQSFVNSQIIPRIRIVDKIETNYSGSGDIHLDLERLANPFDGYMDDIHYWRNLYGADMVSLIVEQSDPNYCGTAYLLVPRVMYGFAADAFSVDQRRGDCFPGDLVFAHEIGHNLGSDHDRNNATIDPFDGHVGGMYDYSFGYIYLRFPPFINWRTVMAYRPGIHITHYSNPDVTYNGIPTGIREGEPNSANNALSINNTRTIAANWRQSRPSITWVDYAHSGVEQGGYELPYNTLNEGINAHQVGNRFYIKSGTGYERITISKPVKLEAYGGPVTIIGE